MLNLSWATGHPNAFLDFPQRQANFLILHRLVQDRFRSGCFRLSFSKSSVTVYPTINAK